MFSVQRLLGRPATFFGLLEKSANLCAGAVASLQPIATHTGEPPDLEPLRRIRREDKAVVNQIEEMLTRIFVTPIEREDLETVASCLYRVPKKAENFAELCSVVWRFLEGVDLSLPLKMLETAARVVPEMVQALAASTDPTEVKGLDNRLSQFEADVSAVINSSLRRLYEPGGDPLKEIAIHDVYRALTVCIDSVRSCGRAIAHVSLKNS
jgi:uncharacterized protein Yka (UPF0111/DUF47 family)